MGTDLLGTVISSHLDGLDRGLIYGPRYQEDVIDGDFLRLD
jgi:hypothetical protein